MSAADIINELPKLTEAERRAVLKKLLALVGEIEVNRMEEDGTPYRAVDLAARGVDERQAADLRGRLKTFAEDWDRPEAAIYDENPTR